MKVLVTGGRTYTHQSHVYRTLDAVHSIDPIEVVIEGGAKGADTLAYKWAEEHDVDSYRVRAKWDDEGLAAGHKRNARMLEVLGLPDMLIAFPGGKGTAGMVELVEQINRIAGTELVEILDERDMKF